MKKKDHKVLMLAAVGVGAYLLYRNAAAGTTAAGSGATASTGSQPLVSTSPAPVDLTTIQKQAVINWAQGGSFAAAFNQVYSQFTKDEWTQLYDLIFNYFNKGVTAPLLECVGKKI
jgi:hypothetical protein